MGTDLQLEYQCPSCKEKHDFAWMGRRYHYVNEDGEISTPQQMEPEVERAKKRLLIATITRDPERIDDALEELVMVGVRLCLARIIEDDKIVCTCE